MCSLLDEPLISLILKCFLFSCKSLHYRYTAEQLTQPPDARKQLQIISFELECALSFLSTDAFEALLKRAYLCPIGP